jgi:hypothetical protein
MQLKNPTKSHVDRCLLKFHTSLCIVLYTKKRMTPCFPDWKCINLQWVIQCLIKVNFNNFRYIKPVDSKSVVPHIPFFCTRYIRHIMPTKAFQNHKTIKRRNHNGALPCISYMLGQPDDSVHLKWACHRAVLLLPRQPSHQVMLGNKTQTNFGEAPHDSTRVLLVLELQRGQSEWDFLHQCFFHELL